MRIADKQDGHVDTALHKQPNVKMWKDEHFVLHDIESQLHVWPVRKVVYLILCALFFTAVAIKAHEQLEHDGDHDAQGGHDAQSGHDVHSDVHESTLSDMVHRYRHIVYETTLMSQIWCVMHLLDCTAAILAVRYHFSDTFQEMTQALLSSVVFFGFLGLIIAFGPAEVNEAVPHGAGIFFGFGWEGAFHMALHELHLDTTVESVVFFALAQTAILLPAYFGVINNRLCELEKDVETSHH